jgi:ATP-binding cassette subfamily B protein
MKFQHISIFKSFLKEHWLTYSLGIVVLITVDLLQVVIPRLIGSAVDHFTQSYADLKIDLLLIVAVAILTAVLRYAYRDFIIGSTRYLEYHLREKLFSHALRLPLSYFDQYGPGKIMALTTNDITAVRVSVGFGSILFVDAFVMGTASVFMMAKDINWQMTVWSIIPLPFILLTATVMGRSVHTRFRAVQEIFSNLTEISQEMFAGSRVIKGFAAEEMAVNRFATINQKNMAENMAMARLQALYTPITHTAPLICYAIALYMGGELIISNTITIGDFTAFLGYLGLIIWPVMGLGYLINILQRGSASVTRLANFWAEPPYESDFPLQSGQLPTSSVDIHNLTFQYSQSTVPALNNISLHIPSGAVIGIVGRTGSGKSTLLKLLLRLYESPIDTIFFNEQEIHSLDYLTLRQNIGYVPQDSTLFSRTIGENIAFDQSYSREKIIEAAKWAAVQETIDERPQGLGTVLGEKGKRLSGGQQQRVAIARAIIKQPTLLLLDDIFSALDYRTQAKLLAKVQQITAGSTAIIVSQRVAAVKNADFIVVMADGSIVEQGSHQQLVAKRGLYFSLYEQQLMTGEQ